MLVLVEQAVVAVAHAELQRLLGEIVIERRTGDTQKPRQRLPALEHVVQCLAQAAVGLDLLVGELLLHPALERIHHWGAVGLMIGQALRRAERGFGALRLLVIHRGDGRDHVRALAREEVLDVDELAARMHQAVQVHHPFAMALGRIGRQRIGHPQHRCQRAIAQRQQVIEILPGMLATGEEQADRLLPHAAQHRGVDRLARRRGLGLVVLDQRHHACAGIVLVDQAAAGRRATAGGCRPGSRRRRPARPGPIGLHRATAGRASVAALRCDG